MQMKFRFIRILTTVKTALLLYIQGNCSIYNSNKYSMNINLINNER